MNRSVSGAFNLTPGSAYSCKTALGELSYDPNAVVNGTNVPTLTVHGTVFIDGNARIAPTNKQMIRAVGVGTIYVSGSMVITGTNVCAAYSGTTCDWSKPGSGHWDVTQNFLAVVAGFVGGGGQSETSDSSISVTLRSAGFQGELTAANKTEVSQSSTTQGPLVQRGMVLTNALRTYPFGTLSDVDRHAGQLDHVRDDRVGHRLQRIASLNSGTAPADSYGMEFALAAALPRPGLAVGSFLNVVAARLPQQASIVVAALGLPVVRARDRVVRQRPAPLVRGACAGAAAPAGDHRSVVYPAVELVDRAARGRCVLLPFRPDGGRAGRRPTCAPSSSRSRRSTSSTGSSRPDRRCPRRAIVLVAQTVLAPEHRVGARRAWRLRSSSSSPCSRTRAGWAWATSSSRS